MHAALVVARQRDDPCDIADGPRCQPPDQQTVDDAEGHGVHAHANGERQHRDQRKARPAPELTNGEPCILQKGEHG